MKWQGGRRSRNVEDRRGRAPAGVKLGGGVLLVAVVITVLTGDPTALIRALVSGAATSPAAAPVERSAAEDELAEFVTVILADTEDTWSGLYTAAGASYQPPTLVLFTDAVQSACGMNSAAVGPFYCPPDQRVYIDLSFYRELQDRFGAPGDFAQAYVIAHEVGHHVQNLMGIADRVHTARSRASQAESNALSVRMELQADCFAGVWAHHARTPLDPGDIEEGLGAAAAIGDDRLQRGATGRVSPESWTHGSSEQRVRWFRQGVRTGDINACDTFGGG